MNKNQITFQKILRDIEQQIIMERIHREAKVDEPFELMVTFNPHVQMNLETFGADLYGKNYERTIFDVPWFSVMGQEESFKVWSHAIPQKN